MPVWGDAAHLVDLLAVRPDRPGRFVSVARADERRPVVEGSQMLGQAIVAAARQAPGRRAVSASMVFLRAADASRPLTFALDELSAGRTFTTLAVSVTQDDRCCASGILLLDETAPQVIRHAVAPPPAPGPDESEPYDMGVTGREVRIVDGAYTGDPHAPVGPPVLDAWVRFDELPDDPALHAGLLAQFTGHLSIATALRPHAERVLLVHRSGRPPTYAFPAEHVHGVDAEPESEADGYVRLAWDAVDAWFEENEQVFGHPRNPYHRIDCVRTSRQLRAEVSGAVLVDTNETVGLYETALAPKLYVDRRFVRTDLLVASATTTYCPYKGTASYWNAVVDGVPAEDIAWSYEDPLPESLPIRGMLSFDETRATVVAALPR